MLKSKSYEGPERRIHKVYVTRNTEYHVRKDVCVAVKPRKGSDRLATEGGALRMRLTAHMAVGTLVPLLGPPTLGHRLYFADAEGDVLTSPIVAILRPPKETVAKYPPDSQPGPRG